MITAIYTPGTTILHRLSAGTKLIAVLCFGFITLISTSMVASLIALTVALAVLFLTQSPAAHLWHSLRALALLIVLIFGFQLWQRGLPTAVESVATIAALIAISLAYTLTTPVDETTDAIVWALGPLRRFGAQPEKVALGISLMIGSLFSLGVIARENHEAVLARGLSKNPRLYLSPMAIRFVAYGQAKGEALWARGIGD